MITRAQPVDVLFVISRHSLLLDIAGPAEAFRLANLHREASGPATTLSSRLRGAGGDPADLGRTGAGRSRSIAGAAPHADLGRGGRSTGGRDDRGHAGDRGHRPMVERSAARCASRREHAAPPDDDLLGHPARRAGGGARHAPLHHAPRAVAHASRPGAAGAGRRQSRVRGGRSTGVQRGHHGRDRRRAAPHRRGVRRGPGGQRRRGHGRLSAAFPARHRVVALPHAPPPPPPDRAPGPGRDRRRAAARLGHGVAGPGGPRGRASPVEAVHRPRGHLAAALPPVDPARARSPVPRIRRDGHARGRRGRFRLRPAAAPRLEPPVGRVAP